MNDILDSDGSGTDTPGGLPDDRRYALILERQSARPLKEMAQVLAAQLGLHPTDAASRLRYGGGLVATEVSVAVAENLERELEAIGVDTRRVEADSFDVLPRGYKIRGLELLDDVLLARLINGDDLIVPREEIFGVHLFGLSALAGGEAATPTAGVRRRTSRKSMQKESRLLQRALAKAPPTDSLLTRRARQLLDALQEANAAAAELHLTLYCAEPVGPLRIGKNDFDFSLLGEDKLSHSLDNFLLLVETILRYVPEAWNVEKAREFLDSLDPRLILYFKEEEVESFDRWMVQWVRIECETLPRPGPDDTRTESKETPIDESTET